MLTPNGQILIPLSLTSLLSSSMEARIILQIQIPWNPNRQFSRPPLDFHRFIRASSSTSQKPKTYRGPKPSKNLVADFISKNDDLVRSLPIYVGGASLLAVLFNRTVSGIAPVADASSSQSRADLLALGLAVSSPGHNIRYRRTAPVGTRLRRYRFYYGSAEITEWVSRPSTNGSRFGAGFWLSYIGYPLYPILFISKS